MTKYEIFDYELWRNEKEGYTVKDVVPTGVFICTDTSKSSICKKLGFDDPYRLDVDAIHGGVIYVYYGGIPYCELRKID